MLMHFPVDPVMSVASGVGLGSHKNQCLFLMCVFKLWCMAIFRTINCEAPVGDPCTTAKLEPTWTSTFSSEQREADSDLKIIFRLKGADKEKPLWEDVSPQSCAVKTLSSQWDQLFFRNSVLCRKWESDGGEQTIDQVIFLKVFDRLLLKLIIVILLEVIVMYRRLYVLFDIIITSQNLL